MAEGERRFSRQKPDRDRSLAAKHARSPSTSSSSSSGSSSASSNPGQESEAARWSAIAAEHAGLEWCIPNRANARIHLVESTEPNFILCVRQCGRKLAASANVSRGILQLVGHPQAWCAACESALPQAVQEFLLAHN